MAVVLIKILLLTNCTEERTLICSHLLRFWSQTTALGSEYFKKELAEMWYSTPTERNVMTLDNIFLFIVYHTSIFEKCDFHLLVIETAPSRYHKEPD